MICCYKMKLKLNEAIDYAPFLRKLTLPFLCVPKAQTSAWRAKLGPHMLREKGFNEIDNQHKEYNKLYLNAAFTQQQLSAIDPDAQPLQIETIQASFEHSDYHDILRQMLPPEITVPTSFESLGHVAFLNLKPDHYEYRYTIGKVMIDKHAKTFKTIVSKEEKLDNEFRTPVIDLIAGEKNYETTLKEEKTVFIFDVEKVYFCSRLHSERSRILSQLKANEVIADVFCGIGPFSIRAAHEKGCFAYANDLNPECYKYLQKNIKKNKVVGRVTPSCMDGRAFMRKMFESLENGEINAINHFYLNLPAIGAEFLDVFAEGAFRTWKQPPFMIHCTCFEVQKKTEEETDALIVQRFEKIFEPVLDAVKIVEIHKIKSVSTDKGMFCVTLRLTPGPPKAEPEAGDRREKPEANGTSNSDSCSDKRVKH